MDEVVPRLWIGELPSCLTPDYLERANIRWIVSCLRNPPAPPAEIRDEHGGTRSIPKERVFVVPIDDLEDAPAYIYFSQCNHFLANALQESWIADPEPTVDAQDDHYIEGLTLRDGHPGLWTPKGDGSVLVHCQAGSSRSVTVRVLPHADGCRVPYVEQRRGRGPGTEAHPAAAPHCRAQRGFLATVRERVLTQTRTFPARELSREFAESRRAPIPYKSYQRAGRGGQS